MKKKMLGLVLLPIIATTIFSCQKLLDIEETDFIAGDIALRTVANNESLLIGAYAAFSIGRNGTDQETEMSIKLNGVLSDELKSGDFYASQSTHEWMYAPDDVSIRDNYMANRKYYRIIDRVNRVLSALPNAVTESATDEALRSKIQGEALFLRAYSHFELFRYYCKNYDPSGLGMPYMELPSFNPTDVYARIGMGEYFEKILRDLTEAKPLLAPDLSDINRANRITVAALHARVALYMREWNDAITYSTEVIEAVPLSPRADFTALWEDQNTNEVIWKLDRATNNRIGNFYRGVFTRNAAGNLVAPTNISWIPSDKLWNSYDQDNDIRFAAYLKDEPILAALENKPHKIVHKYGGSGYATTNENVARIKVFRVAEMYLIRAEARAEEGSFTGANSAESDLNTLRAARIEGYANETLNSKEAAIDAVLEERFKELAFEGHRFWDLKRRGLAIERLASDAPAAAATTLPANNFRFVMPIPQSEMLANPLMEQNEGYN